MIFEDNKITRKRYAKNKAKVNTIGKIIDTIFLPAIKLIIAAINVVIQITNNTILSIESLRSFKCDFFN